MNRDQAVDENTQSSLDKMWVEANQTKLAHKAGMYWWEVWADLNVIDDPSVRGRIELKIAQIIAACEETDKQIGSLCELLDVERNKP